MPTSGKLRFEEPGGLGLFTGVGGVAKATVARGAPWVLSFELSRNPSEDLDDPKVRRLIEALIRGSAFLSWRAAWPLRLPHLHASAYRKVQQRNQQAASTVSNLELFEKHCPDGAYWLENPDTSLFMWKTPGFERFSDPSSSKVYRCDACRYGAKWRKRTRFGTNTVLAGRRLLCQCATSHLVLRARSQEHGCSWTKVAQAYPANSPCTWRGPSV